MIPSLISYRKVLDWRVCMVLPSLDLFALCTSSWALQQNLQRLLRGKVGEVTVMS